MPEGFAIVGYARTEMSDDTFRGMAREAVEEFGSHAPEGEVWQAFASHLLYVPGEYCFPRPDPSTGLQRPSSSMRLSFGVQSDERVAEGIEKLARAISEAL